MKYILLTFALFYLNVSIWGQEKSIGITLEDVAGMKGKGKRTGESYANSEKYVYCQFGLWLDNEHGRNAFGHLQVERRSGV